MTADFEYTKHGSVSLLTPLSDAAADWVAENIGDDAMYHGRALAIDHRYVVPTLEAIVGDGLTVDPV